MFSDTWDDLTLCDLTLCDLTLCDLLPSAEGKFLNMIEDMLLLLIVLSFFFFSLRFLFDLFLYFCFFLDQLISALLAVVQGKGKSGLKKVKDILSKNPSLLNDGLDTEGGTALMFATVRNSVLLVEFLLSCDGIDVNEQQICV
jgi:phosphatidylglycerophosphate synthase